MGVVLTSLWSRHWGVGGHRSDSCGHGSEPGLWREEEAKEARLCWGQGGEKRTRLQSSRRCSQPSCKIALGGKHSGVGTRKLEYTMRHTRRELPSGWWFYLRRCPQILNSLQRRNTLTKCKWAAGFSLSSMQKSGPSPRPCRIRTHPSRISESTFATGFHLCPFPLLLAHSKIWEELHWSTKVYALH